LVLSYSFKNDDRTFVKTELYFGLSRNDSGFVAEDEWLAFEDTVITLAFPNGSTTHDTKGKWRNEYGVVISEKSKMVALINEMTPDVSAQIDSVREKYKRYHHQTAVLRVDHKVEISF
jgi:phenylpropionate dioxygenase-like ring-hydroxylating dioxygenase large terminal subunit